ncbi:hypothetical protein Z043_124913 [Scleropages formosus]|uniref:Uncharacterized protein n=1 Tax=Scleropages formosus TaxID=113540 RepID=A0A0P7W8W7_SCLFO|nr:hypothetical protein Z043_124913 [Scleropages formosus]
METISRDTNLPDNMYVSLQDSVKDQRTKCKLRSLERMCIDQVERLKETLEDHLRHGFPSLDIWEKTVSFFTLRKALLFHNGYSRCSRDVLRIFPAPVEDVAPLLCQL